MDKTTICVADFFLSGSKGVRLEHLHKLINGYLSSSSTKSDNSDIPRAHNQNTAYAKTE